MLQRLQNGIQHLLGNMAATTNNNNPTPAVVYPPAWQQGHALFPPQHEPGAETLVMKGLADYNADPEKLRDNTADKDFGREAALAIGALREHLMVHMNDDCIAGTLFPPVDVPDTVDTPDGAPGLRVKIRGKETIFPCTSKTAQALYDAADVSPVGIHGQGDVVDVAKRKAREVLASDLELPPCLQGERIMDFFPAQLRKSVHKRLLPEAEDIAMVPYKLNVYATGDFFVKHRDAVHDVDTWGTLVVHLPLIGDFLDPAFAGRSPDRFSFFSNDSVDWEEPDERDYDDSIEPRYVGESKWNDQYGQKSGGSEDDDEVEDEDNDDAPAAASGGDYRGDKRTDGGALRCYIGRSILTGNDSELVKFERGYPSYEPSNRASSQYVASVLMQNYSRSELVGGVVDPEHETFANVLALPREKTAARRRKRGGDGEDGDEDGEDEDEAGSENDDGAQQQQQQSTLTYGNFRQRNTIKSGERRVHCPLHFFAFHCGVMHDVRPIKSGHRITLTYKILRRGRHLPTPRLNDPVTIRLLENAVAAMLASEKNKKEQQKRLEMMQRCSSSASGTAAAVAIGNAGDEDAGSKNKATDATQLVRSRSRYTPEPNDPAVGLGIALRHTYPAATVRAGLLRGVDKIIYDYISERWETFIMPVQMMRSQYEGRCWAIQHELSRVALLTADPLEMFNELEYLDERLCAQYPIVNGNTAWIDLGHGMLRKGGVVTGNCDCHLDFYHQSAALITTLSPSRWRRRKVLFWIVAKGKGKLPEELGKYYGPLRNVAYYL